MNTEKEKFSFFLAPAMQVKPMAHITVEKAYEHITLNVDAMTATQKLREIHDPKEHRAFKARNFAFCTFSGTFSYRSRDGLLKHSQLLCLDFDHLGSLYRLESLRQRLTADPKVATALCFISPSGDGLKWVVRIDTLQSGFTHEQWFDALSRYVMQKYDVEADAACRDVCRSCFLPHDSTCYINRSVYSQPIIGRRGTLLEF